MCDRGEGGGKEKEREEERRWRRRGEEGRKNGNVRRDKQRECAQKGQRIRVGSEGGMGDDRSMQRNEE